MSNKLKLKYREYDIGTYNQKTKKITDVNHEQCKKLFESHYGHQMRTGAKYYILLESSIFVELFIDSTTLSFHVDHNPVATIALVQNEMIAPCTKEKMKEIITKVHGLLLKQATALYDRSIHTDFELGSELSFIILCEPDLYRVWADLSDLYNK
jgi:hypothetical protein